MDYREIKIYLYTNLEGEKNEKIPFQSSMLVHPDITSHKGSNPYISFNSLYNYAPLTDLTLQQRVDFFFNTNSHPLLLNIYPGLITKNVLNTNVQSRDNYITQSNHIIKNNIECMLQLLFIISPLNSINVTGSLEIVTEKIQIPNMPTFYGFFNGVKNVELSINNEKYSFERLIWMDDFLNNPIYDDLFKRTKNGKGEKYIKFKNWLNDAIARTKNYSTNNNYSKVKESLDELYRYIIEKKTTIENKNDKKNVFKCFLLYYILNPTANSSLKHDDTEFLKKLEYKNTGKDVDYIKIKKLIVERKNLDTDTKPAVDAAYDAAYKTIFDTNSDKKAANKAAETAANTAANTVREEYKQKKSAKTSEINALLNNQKYEFLKKAFQNNNFNALDDEMAKFETEYEKIKKQIEEIKISKDALHVAYLKSIVDFATFNSFTVDNMREWFPEIKEFIDPTKLEKLMKATNDTKEFIESLFDIDKKNGPIKDVQLSFSDSFIEKPITSNFEKDCNDYLKNEEINQKIKDVLENMEKKTYENIKEKVKDAGFNILYRQPGETIDFSIYNDFIFTFVNQELGLKHISSNEFLQNIISMKEDKDVEKFFLFLNNTYNHFYLGDGSSYEYANELFTGVNFSRQDNSYEIFVLCDLYKSDNSALYGKQNCSNKNKNLGKNLEYILSQKSIGLERNRQKWDLLYNRAKYISSNDANVSTSSGIQNPQPVQQRNQPVQQRAQPVQQRPINVIDTNIFNQIFDEIERQSKKDTVGKEDVQLDPNYWQFNKTLSLLENINLYDRGINPFNLLSKLSSGDEYEKKLYIVIGECFKTMNRYSQTVYNKLNLLKGEFNAVIENNVSQQKSSSASSDRLDLNEMTKLNAQCAKYFLYIKIIEKLSELENKKPKIGGFKKNKKYRTKRLRLSNKRFTRKNNYSRMY
jgi:hypothetical protein